MDLWGPKKEPERAPFPLVSGGVFERIAVCNTSRNSPHFSNSAQICDVVKYKCQNNLGMLRTFNFEVFFALQTGKASRLIGITDGFKYNC